MNNYQFVIELAERLGETVFSLEKKLGLSHTRLDKAITRNSRLSSDILDKIIDKYPNVNREWLQAGQGHWLLDETQPADYRPLSIGTDIRHRKAFGPAREEDGLVYVPVAAQAGYTRAFYDPVYVNQLEKVRIPGIKYQGDNYRMFEVEGDSMQPTLEDGMQVIAQLVPGDAWKHIQQYYIHVIVTADQIMVKRLYYREEKQDFILISDNEALYPQQRMPAERIKELWFVKRNIDWRMPPPKKFEIMVD